MNEVLQKVKAHKYFYRDYYRRVCNVLWLVLMVILVLSLIDVYLFIQREEPNYYATSNDGKLVRLAPLEHPNYSKTPLIE